MNVYQYVCASFPSGFEGGMRNLIVLVPDYCLSFYFVSASSHYHASYLIQLGEGVHKLQLAA